MPANLQKARDLFLHAVGKLPPEQWDGYVTDACGGDTELQRQVGHLLQVHRDAGSFLTTPAVPLGRAGVLNVAPPDGAPAIGPLECPGTIIGPYKLLEEIGEGGMGTVYMAEQTEPVRRTVALKLIKPGMDSREVIGRFDAERHALALMDHPNIAKVLDAGTTDSGRPYFVMELVKGVPVTKYCDNHNLTPRERIALFIPVCQSVQHAHQKGIIHRDLKPSNVLVARYDDRPVPKVIDFGVAKATGQKLTERTLFTHFGQLVGTLEYMSPEQAAFNALDVDTRSDIYSLGVLLYELLTGSTPFARDRLSETPFDEVLRIIREEEPQKPSTRVTTLGEAATAVTANRRSDPRQLCRCLRGELDWIVMKALEKDRNRRYATANSIALDLQRYLADEPVQACPPSAAYRFRKFAKRNKGPLAGVIGAALVLLLLVAGLLVHNVAVTRERDDKQSALDVAEAQRRRAQANLQHSLNAIAGMLDLTQTHIASLPRAEGVHERFLQAALESCQRIGDAEGDDPTARRLTARAYTLVGQIKSKLGHAAEAEQALRKASDLCAKLADEHPENLEHQADRAASQYSLGSYMRARGRGQEAEPLLRQSVTFWKQVLADPACRPDHERHLASALRELGYLYWSLDRCREAEDSYQEALKLFRDFRATSPDEANASRGLQASLHNSLGVLLRTTGRLSEAEEAFRVALQVSAAEEGRSRGHLGVVLWMMGRMEEAEGHLREAVREREAAISLHPKEPERRRELALWYRWLGLLLSSTGQTREAEQTLRQALKVQEEVVKEFPVETNVQEELAGTQRCLGNLLRDTARWPEAETAYRAALIFQEAQVKRTVNDADDLAALALTCKDYGNLLAAMGKTLEAKPFFDKARRGLQRAQQLRVEPHAERYTLRDHSARFLATCPDTEFRDPSGAVDTAKKAVGLAPQVGSCWSTLGIAYYRVGRWQVSADALQKAGELRAGGDGFDWFFQAMARWQLGEKEQARKWYDRAVQWMEKNQPQNEELKRFRAEAAELLGVK